jgi:hypothetical protein
MISRLLRLILLTVVTPLLLLAVAHASVDLNYFVGEFQGNQVVLRFETASETDHAAFYLWRSTTNLPITDGQLDTTLATRVNAENAPILNPNGFCTLEGHTYTYTDTTVSAAVNVYYYYLESIDCTTGNSTFYGNEANSAGLMVSRHVLYLPIVRR